MLQRGHSGDGSVLTSTLCTYTLRKGDLFDRSWARVRRVSGRYLFIAAIVWRRCAQYLLLPLVARRLDTIDVCIWRLFVLCVL